MSTKKSFLSLVLIELLLLLCLVFGSSIPSDRIYYLSLGDSFAAGVEPTPKGSISPAYSYADALYELLKKDHSNLKLIKYGCEGVTSGGIINRNRCNKENQDYSQLDQAVDFMKSNKGLVKFVTIIIGINDLRKCNGDDEECDPRLFEEIAKNLDQIIPKLKEAGGEGVIYIGSTYYSPFRNKLSDILSVIYYANAFKVADMRTIFDTNGADYMKRACIYTNACNEYHDSHPNIRGSRAIGDLHYKVLNG